MPKYRVTVQELNGEPSSAPKPSDFVGDHGVSVISMTEVFSQTFESGDFDIQTLVSALNRKRRVRKARTGKDAS